jgi:hypothetical protein
MTAKRKPSTRSLAPPVHPQEAISTSGEEMEVYLDTLRIFNTHNNLSPRPGLPKYLEIRGSGIFNGTENGTELNVREVVC